MSLSTKLFASTLALFIVNHEAFAQRTIRIDTDFVFSPITGQRWNGETVVALPKNGLAVGSMDFQLNFGSGAKDYDFAFNQNGYVTFFERPGSAVTSIPLPSNGNFIAPFAFDMAMGGLTSFGCGAIDTAMPFFESQAQEAMRFTWMSMCPAGDANCTNPASFQVVLIDRGSGDFDVEMNYGNFDPNAPASFAGQYGLQLGSNVVKLSDGRPFNGSLSPDYYFRNGVMAPVPEPSTYAMLIAGLGLVGLALRARRRS